MPTKAFWELFSGSARATTGFREAGWSCGQPIDVADDETFNLLDPCFLALVISLIWEGLIALLWLGPPCSSFSMVVNRFRKHAMRSAQFPGGFPWLNGERNVKLRPAMLSLWLHVGCSKLPMLQAQEQLLNNPKHP